MNKSINTEDYYIASIDLLGAKDIIKNDVDDRHLNNLREIYNSWNRIVYNSYSLNMKIRFFSDNVVIAIKSNQLNAADELLQMVGDISFHFLQCGYKPRGGICKGKFYIDDIFVWGTGLMNAYVLESQKANYPRIILGDKMIKDVSERLSEYMLCTDDDGMVYLNYLKCFGGKKDLWIEDITKIKDKLRSEFEVANENIINNNCSDEDKKIYEKIEWLIKFVDKNLLFWKNYQC